MMVPDFVAPMLMPVVLLFLVGAPSQLDTWDMKPDAPREIRGPFNPINTNADFQVSELFPLHAIFDKNGERLIGDCEIQARGRTQRDNGPRAPMSKWLLANAMVYGLINVRTDGRKIVMGVLKEGESSFQVEEFTP